jgi:hypothetical protein
MALWQVALQSKCHEINPAWELGSIDGQDLILNKDVSRINDPTILIDYLNLTGSTNLEFDG